MKLDRFSMQSLLAPQPQHRSRGWRRRSAALLLSLVLIGLIGYWYLTREARLIATAGSFLEGLTGGEVTIGRIDFSFFGGIDLANVVIRAPKRFDFGPAEGAGRVVFEVADLHLEHRPLSLLIGRFEVKRVVAIRPRFQIVRQKDTGLSNWQAMLSNRDQKPGARNQQYPVLHLRQCVLRSGTADGRQVSFADPVEVDLLAVPSIEHPGQYTCTFQPKGQDRLTRTLRVDLTKGRIAGDLPGIWISQLLPSLPAQYAKWCEIFELTGQVGAESIEFEGMDTGKCTINLADVALSVPLDESEFYGEQVRARRLVRMDGVAGQIVFEPTRVSFDIAGRMNHAPCRVWGTVTGYTGPLGEMGYDVRIDARRIAVPDRSDPYVAAQVSRLPLQIQKYFRLFDPTAG